MLSLFLLLIGFAFFTLSLFGVVLPTLFSAPSTEMIVFGVLVLVCYFPLLNAWASLVKQHVARLGSFNITQE